MYFRLCSSKANAEKAEAKTAEEKEQATDVPEIEKKLQAEKDKLVDELKELDVCIVCLLLIFYM